MKLKLKYTLYGAVSALIAVSLLFTVSCRRESYDEDELRSAAAELIEASYEINNIFFGSGLPTVGAGTASAEDSAVRYAELSDESPYRTEEEIRHAALLVYTPEYCESIFETVFSGASSVIGEDSAVLYARYIDYNGILTARILKEDEILQLDRTYDTSSIEIVRIRSNTAEITVPSFKNGVPSDDISLRLVMTDDGWRLDTPTY